MEQWLIIEIVIIFLNINLFLGRELSPLVKGVISNYTYFLESFHLLLGNFHPFLKLKHKHTSTVYIVYGEN